MSSLLFAGTENSYVTIPYDPSMNIAASSDFTIEWFQYQTDSNTVPRIFQRGTYPDGTIGVSIELGVFYLWLAGSPISIQSLSAYKNQWVHFAISRNSGVIRVFRNGTQIGSIISNNNAFTSTNNLVIGNESTPSLGSAYGGYLYGPIWTNNVGKYPSNFTVPTTFTVTSNTLLFLTGGENYGKLANQVVKTNVSTSTQMPSSITVAIEYQWQIPDNVMIPYIQAQRRPVLSNNLIFYKPKSLAPCGVGSASNSRVKGRRT